MSLCGSDDIKKFVDNRYPGRYGMSAKGFKTVVIGREKDSNWKNKWDNLFYLCDGDDELETSSTLARKFIKASK